MNIRLISTNIEIFFWSCTISLLSDSEVVQRMVRKVHFWLVTGKLRRALGVALLVSCAGFLMGMVLGFIGA